MDIQPSIRCRILVPAAKMVLEPSPSAELDTQALFGETVQVLEREELWARVRADLDGKEGWIQAPEMLLTPVAELPEPTHRVAYPREFVYSEPNFKSAPVTVLSMNSLVTAGERELSSGGEGEYTQVLGLIGKPVAWMLSDRLRPIDQYGTDFVAEAEKFLGIPYGWGFRDANPSIDCSALLQQVRVACGDTSCARDVGQQVSSAGDEFKPSRRVNNRRGDLIFWTGGKKGRHVVIMIDSHRCIHVTIAPPHRGVTIQKLEHVIADQYRDDNGHPTMFRRYRDYRA